MYEVSYKVFSAICASAFFHAWTWWIAIQKHLPDVRCICLCVSEGVLQKKKQLKGSPELGARIPHARHGLSAFLRFRDRLRRGTLRSRVYDREEQRAGATPPSFSLLFAQSWGSMPSRSTSHGFHSFYPASYLWRAISN